MILRNYQGPSDHPIIAALDGLMGLGILNFCDPTQDMIFAEADGQTLGYARVWQNIREHEVRYFIEVSLCPPEPPARRQTFSPQPQFIEQGLLDWSRDRVQAMSSQSPPVKHRSCKFFTSDSRHTLIAQLQAQGYAVERTDLVMARALDGDIAIAPLPNDIEIRPAVWQDSAALVAAVGEVFDQAIYNMPNTMTADEFEQWLSGMPAIASASWVAWSVCNGTVVGFACNDIDHAHQRGIISDLGTRPSWRRRGIAHALIGHSLRHFQSLGLREATIEVNDFNRLAIRAYERWGFAVISRKLMFSKSLA